jgi:propionyl-CoA carboxylase alpha chain
LVFDANEFKYKNYMAPVVKVDNTKSVVSPMPGKILSVSVKVGQVVEDGQELCIIEAMKMQNILKSQRAGKVKAVTVAANDSVTVD